MDRKHNSFLIITRTFIRFFKSFFVKNYIERWTNKSIQYLTKNNYYKNDENIFIIKITGKGMSFLWMFFHK
jgi:hypothetical protein